MRAPARTSRKSRKADEMPPLPRLCAPSIVEALPMDVVLRDPTYRPNATPRLIGRIADALICDKRDTPFLGLMALLCPHRPDGSRAVRSRRVSVVARGSAPRAGRVLRGPVHPDAPQHEPPAP